MTTAKPHCLILTALILLALPLSPVSSLRVSVAHAATADVPSEQKPPVDASPLSVPPEIADLCPAYPGAVVIDVVKASEVLRTMYKTPDEPAKVSEHYKNELTQRGWALVHESYNDGARLVLRKEGTQIGFGAYRQRRGFVTFFVSLIKPGAGPQLPEVEAPPMKSPARGR